MDIFKYDDFRVFLQESLQAMPKAGHGQNKLLAKAAGVSTAFFSQMLNNKRQLSLEQGSLIAEFLGFSDAMTEYFLTLIELDRAGNQLLRKHLIKRKNHLKKAAQVISKRFSSTTEVSEQDKPLYYSDWYYIATQQLTAIPDYKSEFSLAKKLNLPIKKIREVISFLLDAGLCVEKEGQLSIGPARIHLPPDSPWIKQHHSNWRMRALENINNEDLNKLHYSSPMTLSRSDVEKVRAHLISAIEGTAKIVDPSPSEELYCLNIDWFRIC